jgi:tetratricopeptide (TPR) repeat protein
MDTFYTIEEKYLQAVDELNYGETPKGLRLLNEIIANDPLYARAHYQLGKIHYYDLQDYQTAGYHFKTGVELEPAFPDIYYHYMHLVVFLNMENQVKNIKVKALNTAGVEAASIYELSGLFFEKNKNWEQALADYRKAFIEVTDKHQKDNISESIERVKLKAKQHLAYTYNVVD